MNTYVFTKRITEYMIQRKYSDLPDSKYAGLLQHYPQLTRPQQSLCTAPPTQVTHHIETRGTPVCSKARRLAPEKYQAAKEEFD
ncbi:hypothetical protein ACUWCL_29060, partial [Klebsiella pneumoniae]|uniref:hypothetical protein n=1 Tax=Klebsiella pneumoniae TaxID=573 RepID=UPI00405546B3